MTHTVEGRTYLYRALEPRKNVAAQAVKQIIDRFCGGSLEELLAGMVESDMVRRKGLEQVPHIIARKKEKTMENRTPPKGSRWLGIVAALVCFSSGVLTGQTVTTIDTIDHRPLAGALAKAEAVLGIAINYEDVPYENPADLEDASTAQQRSAYPGYRLLVPRKGQSSATIHGGAAMPDGEKILNVNALLNSYRANNLPGDFTIEQANGMLYVVPTKLLAANGSTRSVQSLMKTVVSVPYAERTVAETVAAILQSVSSATGARISVGSLPFFPRETVSFGVSRESARDALAGLFAKLTTRPLSYQLLFDPLTAYMFNVRVVPSVASPTPVEPPVQPSPGGSHFFARN